MKSLLVALSVILVMSPIILVSCMTNESHRVPASDAIRFESQTDQTFKRPFISLSGKSTLFNADSESALGVCRYFGFKKVVSFKAGSVIKADLTLFGKEGVFTILHQPEQQLAIDELSCGN